MITTAGDPGSSKDPSQDPAFERLISAWSDGSLGLDKHQGIGLLWKEGLVSDLLATFFRRAPVTMRALGESLAVGAPQFSQDKALIPRCLILEFVDAMALTLRQRRNRFDALDLPEPTQDMHAAFAEIDPPMERRFRSAIEAWVDTAAGIEARLKSLSRQPPAEVAA